MTRRGSASVAKQLFSISGKGGVAVDLERVGNFQTGIISTRCRLLARLRHADCIEQCPLAGVTRSAPGDRQGVDGASPSR